MEFLEELDKSKYKKNKFFFSNNQQEFSFVPQDGVTQRAGHYSWLNKF